MILSEHLSGAMCGSYAFVQTLRDEHIDIHLLEMSSGSPFGSASFGDDLGFARILTVFRDFNDGIDKAAPLFGINVERRDFNSSEEVAKTIFNLHDNENIMCGPVNMSFLAYLPVPYQYRASDHFITFFRDGELFVSDSEGMPALLIPSESELSRMLSVRDIPEAKGLFTLRKLSAINQPEKNIEAFIIETAAKNFCEAESHGQGSEAFVKIAGITKLFAPVKWSVPLNINLSHYMYRKLLADILFKKFNVPSQLHSLNNEALHIAGNLRFILRRKEYENVNKMLMKLSDIERKTALYMEKKIL